jgi:predicted O-methyltransferase YrrM
VLAFPPGHYYSPIPNSKDVLARELFDRDTKKCPGVDLREEAQLGMLEIFSRYYDDLPWDEMPSKGMRYYFENPFFAYGEAIVLYTFLRHYKPRRVLEVGSGFSSAAMLDINDLFLEQAVRFTFVEPSPERLFELLDPEDDPIIVRDLVQDVPLELFSSLHENDILFVDSSHVAKIGSDVAHILFEVLPALRSGVLVHFHDVFWPFEYPKEWFLRGWAWNESYFLRSFLQYNTAFEIVYFNSYLGTHHRDSLREKLPLCSRHPGSSLWLRRV